ncbi:MAG TPA: serine kinase [Lachnospiraceae bacterium]|nr:serine kinase [Lachnospiraceae bacterium]
MKTVTVLINTFAKVQAFQAAVSHLQGTCTLLQTDIKVDAKSLLGIYALDISRPLRLDIDAGNTDEDITLFLKDFLYTSSGKGL